MSQASEPTQPVHFETSQIADVLRMLDGEDYGPVQSYEAPEPKVAAARDAVAGAMEEVLGIDAYEDAARLAQRYPDGPLAAHEQWQDIFGYREEQRGDGSHDRGALEYFLGENIGLVLNEAERRIDAMMDAGTETYPADLDTAY